jgi:hypothetical protein
VAQDPDIASALALLDEIGAEDVAHPRGTLADHLHGTYDILRRWGCPPDVYRAGLYHSVYGTDVFQTVTLAPDARDKVTAAIGPEAERLAYLYCALVRDSLYENLTSGGPPYRLRDRSDGSSIEITRDEYASLVTIDLANRLEQLPHSRASEGEFLKNRARYMAAIPLLPPAAVQELRNVRVSQMNHLARRAVRSARRALRR